jgi:hypothetical protein
MEYLKQWIQAEISSNSPTLLKHIHNSLNFHFQTYFECNLNTPLIPDYSDTLCIKYIFPCISREKWFFSLINKVLKNGNKNSAEYNVFVRALDARQKVIDVYLVKFTVQQLPAFY